MQRHDDSGFDAPRNTAAVMPSPEVLGGNGLVPGPEKA